MKKLLTVLAITGLMVVSATSAQAITLDFNSIPLGIQSEATFNSNFTNVSFNNTGGSAFNVSTFNPGPSFSGRTIINHPFNTIGNSTIATFTNLVNFVSIDLGDNNADADNLFLRAYNSLNSQIGITTTSIPASFRGAVTLTLAVPNIHHIEYFGVGVSNNSVAWDNLIFTEQGGSNRIPEPASMMLLGSGLVGMVRLRKKKKFCKS